MKKMTLFFTLLLMTIIGFAQGIVKEKQVMMVGFSLERSID